MLGEDTARTSWASGSKVICVSSEDGFQGLAMAPSTPKLPACDAGEGDESGFDLMGNGEMMRAESGGERDRRLADDDGP